ncbi:MAG: hypothetical protein M3M91_07400, partial [Thermoproteota archaeon]|nr:hypothetical protein [Thermoproteota archaeon]
AFEEPGVYPYFCAIHPWMSGQVIVSGGAQTETGTQPLGNETATTTTTTTTSANATTPDAQPPAAETETGTQPLGNETATTADTQDLPLSTPDAETPASPPPSAGADSPNPIFG